MSNLNIGNISNIVQSGDIEKLYQGSLTSGTSGSESVSSEARVAKEMQNQGMASHSLPDAGTTFSDVLRDSVDKVNLYQTQADTAVKELVAGKNKNIHETMLTIERADTSLKLMMQVRNKILDAYKEIMRMQV
jgi:flagellar hook-basal body complex protein FliE